MIDNIFNAGSKKIKNKLLDLLVPSGFHFRHKGYCPCCDREVTFRSSDSWLRDHFVCSNCNSIPRERALMLTIEKYYPDWRDMEIHESSPVYRGASIKLRNQCKNYLASQYYCDRPLGSIIDDFRNEDLENQTFPDRSFDIVITQDVMEHIYDPEKAFKEIARTLKNGGAHIFTVPIINRHQPTEKWAVKGSDNSPIFLRTEEYHGNPVDPKGSPVTMHWGFDIVDFIRSSSGLETKVEYIDDLNFGVRAELIEVLVSRKD